MTLTPELLKQAMPGCDAEKFCPILNDAMAEFGISEPVQQAMFLAQIGHESCSLTCFEENLNYRAGRLAQVWPKHFSIDGKPHNPPLPGKLALSVANKPEPIANIAYANRMGNGSPESRDGYRYRGRGAMQITGRSNYEQTGVGIGLDLIGNPDLLLDPVVAIRAAAWFWRDHDLNKYANDVAACTRTINGGSEGLEARKYRFDTAKKVLCGE